MFVKNKRDKINKIEKFITAFVKNKRDKRNKREQVYHSL